MCLNFLRPDKRVLVLGCPPVFGYVFVVIVVITESLLAFRAFSMFG